MPLEVHTMVLRYWHFQLLYSLLQNNVILDLAVKCYCQIVSWIYQKFLDIFKSSIIQATLLTLKLILNNYYLIIFCRNCPSQYLNLCEHLPVEVQMESCTQVKIIAALNFNLFMVSFIHSFLCSFLCLFLSSFIHTFSQPVHMSIPPSVPPSVHPSIRRSFRLSICQSVSWSVMHT